MVNSSAPKPKGVQSRRDPRRIAFERLFERRLESLKEDARLMSNLSNPYNYQYDAADVERLRVELNALVRTTVDSFENRLPSQAALIRKRNLER